MKKKPRAILILSGQVLCTLVLSFLALSTLALSPLYADYSKMNETLENYTPPEYFKDSLNFKTQENRPDMTTGKNLTAVLVGIENMKLEYEKKISKGNEILFMSDFDSKLFSQLVKISQDKEAVKKIISYNLILDEIEILSALRNPAILSAQKKVKAEIESFNQVMDLDANLEQYSAFTEGINTKIGPLKMKDSIKKKYPFI